MAIIAYAIIAAVINWVALLFHVAWIVGLAVILATFSYHHWQANQQNRSLREQVRQSSFVQPVWVGLILVAIGLAGTSQTVWEAIIWVILSLIALFYLLKSRLPLRSSDGN